MNWPQTPAPPYSALIRRQHQRELEINDDICLTEEMERRVSGQGWGGGGQAARPLHWAALEDSPRRRGGVRGGEAKLALWST